MILPKNRTLAVKPARATSTGRAIKSRNDATGAPAPSPNKTVEVSFVLPVDAATQLTHALQASERSDATPIVLWIGRKGEIDITVRDRTAGDALPSADPKTIVARAKSPVPEGAVGGRADLGIIEAGHLVINPGRHEVLVDGKATPQLTFTEFGILYFLARHAGWVFGRQQIVQGLKGKDYPVTDRAVDVQVAGLRKKLGTAATCVQTVRGVGYRFRDT